MSSGSAHISAAASPNYDFLVERAIAIAGDRGARILDFGSGSGAVVARGRARGYDFHGADLYAGYYESVVSIIDPDAKGFCARIEGGRIPADDNSFDVVVSNQVFEHVHDADTALAEIARVLKPGGWFLAVFPTAETWFEGHVGVYFAHWLPPRSILQRTYLRAARRLGFGYDKRNDDVERWALRQQTALNDAVVYRSMQDINALWQTAFGAKPTCEAAAYMHFRILMSRFKMLARLADLPGARWLLAFVCHKRAGRVLLVKNGRGVSMVESV